MEDPQETVANQAGSDYPILLRIQKSLDDLQAQGHTLSEQTLTLKEFIEALLSDKTGDRFRVLRDQVLSETLDKIDSSLKSDETNEGQITQDREEK